MVDASGDMDSITSTLEGLVDETIKKAALNPVEKLWVENHWKKQYHTILPCQLTCINQRMWPKNLSELKNSEKNGRVEKRREYFGPIDQRQRAGREAIKNFRK